MINHFIHSKNEHYTKQLHTYFVSEYFLQNWQHFNYNNKEVCFVLNYLWKDNCCKNHLISYSYKTSNVPLGHLIVIYFLQLVQIQIHHYEYEYFFHRLLYYFPFSFQFHLNFLHHLNIKTFSFLETSYFFFYGLQKQPILLQNLSCLFFNLNVFFCRKIIEKCLNYHHYWI